MLVKLIFSYSTDDAIWQPLAEKLTKLVSVTLIGHKWSETEALMRAIGQRLKRIYLALRGFIPNLEDNLAQPPPASTVPKLEQLLDLCPQLEDLTISFGPLTLNVSDEALIGNVQLFSFLLTFLDTRWRFLPKLHSNENHEKIVKLCLHFFPIDF